MRSEPERVGRVIKFEGIWSTLSTGPLNLMPLMVYPKVLFPLNSIILAQAPDDKICRYLVFLKYWTLNLMPLMIYPKVLSP